MLYKGVGYFSHQCAALLWFKTHIFMSRGESETITTLINV